MHVQARPGWLAGEQAQRANKPSGPAGADARAQAWTTRDGVPGRRAVKPSLAGVPAGRLAAFTDNLWKIGDINVKSTKAGWWGALTKFSDR